MNDTTRGRRSVASYGELFRLVVDRPGTAHEIAARYDGMSPRSVSLLLRQMACGGLLLVTAWRWVEHAKYGIWVPVFGFEGPPAPLPDGARPLNVKRRGRVVQRHLRDVHCFIVLMKALMVEALTPDEVAEIAGMYAPTLVGTLRDLSECCHVIYVHHWMRSIHPGGLPIPLYAFGIDMVSKPRPKPQALRAIWARSQDQRRQRLLNIRMLFITAGKQYPPDLTKQRSKGAMTA